FKPEAAAAAGEALGLFTEAAASLRAAEASGNAPSGDVLVDAVAAGRPVLLAPLERAAEALRLVVGEGMENG
ncbi:MAG: hypothetical protein OXE57_05695, partial [Alphaproteobacteria bacterium]|nr:hypothetical protein [Alphaproteobacteria bacterium]